MNEINKPKRLHVKHIIAGFLYANTKTPDKLRMVTEIETDGRHCKVYLVDEMEYKSFIPRQAIVDGIRNGKLISFMEQKYR